MHFISVNASRLYPSSFAARLQFTDHKPLSFRRNLFANFNLLPQRIPEQIHIHLFLNVPSMFPVPGCFSCFALSQEVAVPKH